MIDTLIPGDGSGSAFSLPAGKALRQSRKPTSTSRIQQQDRHGFSQTVWGPVQDAGSEDEETRMQALDLLLPKYLPPLRAYLVACLKWKYRLAEDWFDDCLQEFVLQKILKKDLMRKANKQRGRFRDLLKRSALNCAKDLLRRQARQPLEGARREVDLEDFVDVRAAPRVCPADVLWARGVLDDALRRLEGECRQEEKEHLWLVFERRCLRELLSGVEPESLEATAEFASRRLGCAFSTQDAGHAQQSGRRKFGRLLKDVLSEYCRDAEEITEERMNLFEILEQAFREEPETN